jgi:two-component system, sensor histidine kinase and response regulator
MKILIADDEPGIRDSVALLLELHGHEVIAAADGKEALRRLAERPDLVFCDVDMPGMNGFEVLERARATPEGQAVPFIFLTGRTERAHLRRGMELGADDYITKPFGEQDIVRAIEARTRRQRTVRERIDGLVAEQRHVATAAWSHELLTPLVGVLGGVELIENEAERLTPAELREILGMVRAGAERQQRLSRKLIAYFGLLAAEGRAGDATETDLGGLVEAAAGEVAAQERRQADVACRCEPALGLVDVPGVALAVRELVENACKFSRPGARVEVVGRADGARYRLTVDDAGCGMTEAERAQIGPFVQFGRERREQQGLGLGLAIARLVAACGGGELRLAASPAGGTRAELDLPLAAS